MNSRVFSVILLPSSECNVACDYCFEHNEPHRLSSVLVPLLTRRLLDHLEHEDIEECEIYWQGGEAMIMGPGWYADAGKLMDSAAAACGHHFTHYLQTNLISYSPTVAVAEDPGDFPRLPVDDARQDQVQAAAGVRMLPQLAVRYPAPAAPPTPR